MASLQRFALLIICISLSSSTEKSSQVSASKATMAFASSTPPAKGESDETKMDEAKIPQLPVADPNADIPCVKLGETIRLEEYGPIILNTDGTARRIDNWNEMTEKEKEVTWRRISKRNEERRQALLKQQQEEEAADMKEL